MELRTQRTVDNGDSYLIAILFFVCKYGKPTGCYIDPGLQQRRIDSYSLLDYNLMVFTLASWLSPRIDSTTCGVLDINLK